MSPTLPLSPPRRTDLRLARVIALGGGWPPKTCEARMEDGTQVTIWWADHRVGDRVELEQRMSASGPYWAAVGLEGSR